jgi:excinuclease UvrABC helicase subunit UvrB
MYIYKKLKDMITATQKRQQILRKIYRIPFEKLKELDNFVSKLVKEIHKKSKNLSFAGAWQNIDDSILKYLTENLISNNKKLNA